MSAPALLAVPCCVAALPHVKVPGQQNCDTSGAATPREQSCRRSDAAKPGLVCVLTACALFIRWMLCPAIALDRLT